MQLQNVACIYTTSPIRLKNCKLIYISDGRQEYGSECDGEEQAENELFRRKRLVWKKRQDREDLCCGTK